MGELFQMIMTSMVFVSSQIYFAVGKKKEGRIWLGVFLLAMFVWISDHGGSQIGH